VVAKVPPAVVLSPKFHAYVHESGSVFGLGSLELSVNDAPSELVDVAENEATGA
jgi:hypothetical protein